MTVIRPNSISGITSLTAHRGSIDFYAHDGSAARFDNINSNVTSGVSTFASLNITGDLDVGGALTYEDVTNIDSVGIITANAGIVLQDYIFHKGDTNTSVGFPSNDTIDLITAGTPRLRVTSIGSVIQVGNGSISNPAVTLSGTAPSDTLVTTSTGKIGFGTDNPLNGLDIFQSDGRTRVTSFGHIITQNRNHGTTNYWSIAPRNGGELDIAYGPGDSDGTVTGDKVTITQNGRIGIGIASPTSLIHGQVSSGSAIATLESTATSGEASVSLKGKNSSGTVRTGIFKYDSADMFRIGTTASIPIRFETNDTERMRILPTGGITFGGDTSTANALDDYEEGTMSWRLQRSDNIGAGSNVNTRVNYTKIGNRVYVSGYIYTQNTGSSTSNVNIVLRDNSNTNNVATLPYPPNHSGGFPVTGTRTISDNYRNMAVTFQENSSTVYLYRDDGDNNYVKNINNVSVANSQTHLVLQFCGSYTTNS